MAVGLATAIGLGGKLESENSGVAEIIRQTGEGISGSVRQAVAGVKAGQQTINQKEKEKEQYTTPFSTNINALEWDKQKYAALAGDLTNEIKQAANNGASASRLKEMQIKAADKLADAKFRYEDNLKAYVLAESLKKNNMVDISEFDRFVSKGGYDETEVYEEGNVGAGPVAERSGAPFEQGQEQVPGKTVSKRVGVPYFKMTLEQQKQVAPGGLTAELNKRTKDVTGTFNKALQAVFDRPDLTHLIKRTYVKKNGIGGYEFEVDPNEVAQSLNTFLGQRGRTDDVEVKKYWNTLTTVFERKGKDAGLAGQELRDWVDAGVEATARHDFMVKLESVRQKRMSDDKDTQDKEGKGMTIIVGDGGSSVSDGRNVVKFVPQSVPNKNAIPKQSKVMIKEYQEKIADYEKKAKDNSIREENRERYKRAISSLKKSVSILSNRRQSNYFDFSSVINSEDPGISFIGADGAEQLMSPQEIYKDEDSGQLMIGGKIKSKIEEPLLDANGEPTRKMVIATVEEDFSVPYNDQNKSRLFNNKPQLEPLFEKVDWTLLDGKKSKDKSSVSYPKSKAEFDKLPSGAQYVKPGETTIRIKP